MFLQFCNLVGIQSFYAQVANRSHTFLQLWLLMLKTADWIVQIKGNLCLTFAELADFGRFEEGLRPNYGKLVVALANREVGRCKESGLTFIPTEKMFRSDQRHSLWRGGRCK